MTDYRKNADEELQIRHEDTNSWVPAVANLNVAGGFVVTLSASQIQEIQDINTEVQRLEAIATSLDNLDGDADLILAKATEIEVRAMEVRDRTQAILTAITSATNPELVSIDDRLELLNSAIAEIQTLTLAVRDRLGDGTNSALTRLTEIQTATDTLKPDVALIAGAVRSGGDTTINKLMETVTRLNEIKTALIDGNGNTTIARLLEVLTKITAVQAALDDGTEKAIAVLKEMRDSISWKTPQYLNGGNPILDGVNATTASEPVTIPAKTERIFLKSYFSNPGVTAELIVEMRRGIGAVFYRDRRTKKFNITSSTYAINTGTYDAEDWIELDPCGAGEMRVHMRTLNGGTITVYGEYSQRRP